MSLEREPAGPPDGTMIDKRYRGIENTQGSLTAKNYIIFLWCGAGNQEFANKDTCQWSMTSQTLAWHSLTLFSPQPPQLVQQIFAEQQLTAVKKVK